MVFVYKDKKSIDIVTENNIIKENDDKISDRN